MFPTEDLINELKKGKMQIDMAKATNYFGYRLDKIEEALDIIINAQIKYYEWKQGPFMYGMSKEPKT